jgi:hypothetical protein
LTPSLRMIRGKAVGPRMTLFGWDPCVDFTTLARVAPD